MSGSNIEIGTECLNFEQVKRAVGQNATLSLSAEAEENIKRCRAYLDKKLIDSDELYYGINTGIGFLHNVKIDKTQLKALQHNLLQSHACGIGNEVPPEIAKLMLMLKIRSLSFGNSGVSIEVVNRLMEMFNNDVLPVIYTQGSLGSSGDLAPLSHLALPLIGLGEVKVKGERMSSPDALKKFNWQPIELRSKEGIALVNGTQFMSAYGLFNLIYSKKLLRWADVISALSFDAFDCSDNCLHPKLHAVRAHKGQVDTATMLRDLLNGSQVCNQKKYHVQDPYSFRCIPQVHGATKDTFEYVLQVFITEANSVTDNPNIFPGDDLILSGGNFHGQPLALALDFLSIAVAELGSISERRVFQLLSGQRDLPLFLIHQPGLHSGLMIPQYTAASIVSENKQLCTPASVDNIPASNNQEDHNSMGANAATKCLQIVQNVEKVLAIELLVAAQALEFRRPLSSSPKIEKVVSAFRKQVSFNAKDRVLHDDIIKALNFLSSYDVDTL